MRQIFTTSTLAALLALTATSSIAAESPEEFIKDAIHGDNSEIMLGQLAEQKASSPRALELAHTLVTDHTAAKSAASAVAAKLGVTPPDQPAADANDEREKLSKLSGAAFDMAFADFMVKDHRKAIQEFQDEAKANQGPASDLASKQLPTLNKHLEMARTLAQSVGDSGATSKIHDAASQESPNRWRASRLAGVAIYGPDNKKIGAITDVLVNKDGKADSVIIGVGGFLGIGEKDVSVPFDQVKFSDKPVVTPATTATTAPLTNVGATTSKTDSSVVATANTSAAYPDHGTIDMTADQLKQAPTFHFAS